MSWWPAPTCSTPAAAAARTRSVPSCPVAPRMSSRSEDDIDLLSGKCIGHGLGLPRPVHEDPRLIPPASCLPQRASEESSETQGVGHDARKRDHGDVGLGVRFAPMLGEVLIGRLEAKAFREPVRQLPGADTVVVQERCATDIAQAPELA